MYVLHVDDDDECFVIFYYTSSHRCDYTTTTNETRRIGPSTYYSTILPPYDKIPPLPLSRKFFYI